MDPHGARLAALKLGVAMRVAQKKYFTTRSRLDLFAAKDLEMAFDEAARAVLAREQTENEQ